MKIAKLLIATVLVLLLVSCGGDPEKDSDLFTIEIKNPKEKYSANDVLEIGIQNKKGKEINSVDVSLSEIQKKGDPGEIVKFDLSDSKLGKQTISATISAENNTYTISKDIMIYSAVKPKLYSYNILESYPHDINAYTQGLEFENDTLYESTGQYRESTLRKLDYKSGEVLQKIPLEDQYFAEGLTIMNDKLYQLTWQENTGFIYKFPSLEKTGTFVYDNSIEGWGLCNDGEKIYKSDGTQKIWTLNANTLAEEGYIELMTNVTRIPKVNELEWVDGKIYANIYKQSAIAIIDPKNGAVEGVIDLTSLKDNVTQHQKLDVLNGIAYKDEPNVLYVTGKNWDKLFKIEIIEK